MEKKDDHIQRPHPHFFAISFPIFSLKDMISCKKKFNKHILKAANLFSFRPNFRPAKMERILGIGYHGKGLVTVLHSYLWYMVTVHLVFGHLELYLLLVDALQLSGALKALPSARASTSEAFVISL